ncbi:thioredoxin-like protein [Mycena metata]|uniref:Thioredoxin-like protein n=1 Tax=Mycena metata TaxID=1033252 RepID=A0AAD7KCK2_9AGAR|nr:thioredoxin-like protein [Mycena metata]
MRTICFFQTLARGLSKLPLHYKALRNSSVAAAAVALCGQTENCPLDGIQWMLDRSASGCHQWLMDHPWIVQASRAQNQIQLTPTATLLGSNLVAVTDAEHLRTLLSADLARVSLLNFWAPAAPCVQMNAVVAELAKKHPLILALNIEAEEQADIVESFEIDAVPSFVVLQGHTLLARIAGADAPTLTQTIATHAGPLPTSGAPSAPQNETPEQLDARMRALMTQSKVVLFMKGNPEEPRCGFSRKISTLLQQQSVPFSSFDILQDEDVRQSLKRLNDWPTFPQLIVNGEFVGGLDVVQEMVESGELKELVAQAGV